MRRRWLAALLAASCGGGASGGDGLVTDGASDSLTNVSDFAGDLAGADLAGGGADMAAGASKCARPIAPADASKPTTVVGSGKGTCTEALLAAAVKKGGVVTFDCGGPATIAVTAQIDFPRGLDTVVDGGGVITLDGGGKTRLFHFDGGDFRKTTTTFTLQHLALANAKSTGTMIPPAPAPCSQGYDTDGGGAAVLVRDGVLHVIDVTFTGNHAAPPGPDVAGGGVYAIGSLDTTIVASRFVGNQASNGGAVGSLFSNLTLVDDVFDGNAATGSGANYIDQKCMVNGGESGNGGNGGAVSIDGGETFDVVVCGDTFVGNTGGAFGGAIFRTPDLGRAATHVDWSTFDKNSALHGGAAYFHHSDLHVGTTTFSNNQAQGSGAIQADDTNVDFVNSTFYGNVASTGLGGAVALFGNGGTIVNCTFAENHADGGSGLFGGALAGGTALTIRNTVFVDDTSKDCGAPMACADGNSTGEADLQWPKTHLVCMSADPPCATNTTFADPMLGPLADHGGPTLTAAPAAGSPAIGLGKTCPPIDQRGVARKADGCTAGAYEAP